MSDYASKLGVSPSDNQNLFDAINRCTSEADVIDYLQKNRSGLLFVLEHLPPPLELESDISLLEGLVKIINPQDMNKYPKLAEINAFLSNRVELPGRLKRIISDFKRNPSAPQALLTKRLREEIIDSAIHSESADELIAKAPNLISEFSKEEGVQIRFDASPEKIYQEIYMKAIEQALNEGKGDLVNRFIKPAELDAILAPRVSAGNFGNALNLLEINPQCPMTLNALGEIASQIGRNYLDEFEKQIQHCLKGEEIGDDRLKELNQQLISLKKVIPQEVEKIKNQLEARIGKFSIAEIKAITNSARYDPLEKNVVQSYQTMAAFLDKENPEVEDFLECFNNLNQLLEQNKQQLIERRNRDLLLDAYMGQGGKLLLQAGNNIKNKLNEMKVDMRNPALVTRLNDLLTKVPPIFGLTIELNVAMEVQYDVLVSKIAELFPDLDPFEISNWIQNQLNTKGINLELFQDWLLNKGYTENSVDFLDQLITDYYDDLAD